MKVASAISVTLSLCLVACHLSGCEDHASSALKPGVVLQGRGASFPHVLYSQYIEEYASVDREVTIHYKTIGDGGVMKEIVELDTLDFGVVDAPMTNELLEKSGEVLHVPTTVGGIAVTYNLPSLDRPLCLDGPTLASIYLGRIRTWNDPRIAHLNPGADLPRRRIAIALSARDQLATVVFTQYLSTVSDDFKNSVGTGAFIRWPVGNGPKGEESLSSVIKRTPGTISYAEATAARRDGLTLARIRNAAGEIVEPTLDSFEAAAASASLPEDLRGWIVDAKGPGAYPIAFLTYLLIPRRHVHGAYARALAAFVRWILRDDSIARDLGYARVPSNVADRAEQLLTRIDVGNEGPRSVGH